MKFESFIKAIRAKFPQYKDIDDETLADAVIKKYPQYRDQVEPIVTSPTIDYFPEYNPIEFGEPKKDEKDPGFWSEAIRSGHKRGAEMAGEIPGTVMNILGTVPEGEHPTFAGYGLAIMPEKYKKSLRRMVRLKQ